MIDHGTREQGHHKRRADIGCSSADDFGTKVHRPEPGGAVVFGVADHCDHRRSVLPVKFNRLIVTLGLLGYSCALVLASRSWELPSIGLAAAFMIGLALVAELVAKGLFGTLFRAGLLRQGHVISLPSAISAAFVGTAVARLVPAGGALSPSAMAWAVRAEDDHAAGAALRTILTSYGGLLLLTGLAFGWAAWIGGQIDTSLGVALVVASLVLGGSLSLVSDHWLVRLVSRLPSSMRRHFGPTADVGRITAREIGLIMARVTLEAATLWLVLTSLGVEVTPMQTMLTFGTAKVLGAVPFTPGGIGLVEGGMIGALTTMGFSSRAVLAPVLVYQLLDYWVVATVGLLAAGRISRRDGTMHRS